MRKVIGYHRDPAPVGEAVGMESGEGAGAHRDQTEGAPGEHERQKRRAPVAIRGPPLRRVESVDDPTEEHGLGEGSDRQEDVGQREPRPEPAFGTELTEDAKVLTEDAHGGHCGRAERRRIVPRRPWPPGQ